MQRTFFNSSFALRLFDLSYQKHRQIKLSEKIFIVAQFECNKIVLVVLILSSLIVIIDKGRKHSYHKQHHKFWFSFISKLQTVHHSRFWYWYDIKAGPKKTYVLNKKGLFLTSHARGTKTVLLMILSVNIFHLIIH